jgi:hypothetical protein
MGQGQEEKVYKAIFDCAKKGEWIMLSKIYISRRVSHIVLTT